jgi:hypothetical protein
MRMIRKQVRKGQQIGVEVARYTINKKRNPFLFPFGGQLTKERAIDNGYSFLIKGLVSGVHKTTKIISIK